MEHSPEYNRIMYLLDEVERVQNGLQDGLNQEIAGLREAEQHMLKAQHNPFAVSEDEFLDRLTTSYLNSQDMQN